MQAGTSVNGKIAPKSIAIEVADLIPQRGRQNLKSRYGECSGVLPGFVPPACSQRVSWEQGRAAGFKRSFVRSDKPRKRGGSDDQAAVRLAGSTQRSGEPTTRGSGQRKLNCSWETWAPFNGRIRPSMQREESPTMETGLERIAAKARSEPKLRFTSLAHHVTRARVWENLCQIPKDSSPGVDGQTVPEVKESFGEWIEEMLQSMHRQGYQAPDIRRVYIPKPGKQEKRPLGVPCVADRALQRSVAQVLSAIYEQDFLSCSFGGRPGRGAHQALASLHEVIAGGKVEWVLEADLKNFFGSLSHEWMLRFVELRVGDPRLISLIRRWLKANVLEDEERHPNEEGHH